MIIGSFLQSIASDIQAIASEQIKEDARSEAVRLIALRIISALGIVLSSGLFIGGTLSLLTASFGAIPTVVLAIAGAMLSYDCAIIAHNRSELRKTTPQEHHRGLTNYLWTMIPSAITSTSLDTLPLHLRGTVVAASLYTWLSNA